MTIVRLVPNADGSTSSFGNSWTPSTGTDHYALVDEIYTAPDVSDYVQRTTSSGFLYETFQFENLPAEAKTINSVKVFLYCDASASAKLKITGLYPGIISLFGGDIT
ncbi:hypothetical protein LCGC14_2653040, partial [marine sediment metagenome]